MTFNIKRTRNALMTTVH